MKRRRYRRIRRNQRFEWIPQVCIGARWDARDPIPSYETTRTTLWLWWVFNDRGSKRRRVAA